MDQEELSANRVDGKGLTPQICKKLTKLNRQQNRIKKHTTNNLTKTWAKDLDKYFSKRDIKRFCSLGM